MGFLKFRHEFRGMEFEHSSKGRSNREQVGAGGPTALFYGRV